MIVTCPSCSSKYRVRDEAVPAEGAELECPSCRSLFLAYPPKKSVVETTGEHQAKSNDTAQQQQWETTLHTLTSKLHDKDGDIVRLRARVEELTQEVAQAKRSASDSSSGAEMSQTVRSLILAIPPMLWGLEQSIAYLEQFAGNEATLAGHVKQLHLLHKVLKRLVDEV